MSDVTVVTRIVVSAFAESVARGLSQEGIDTFYDLSTPEAFSKRLTEHNKLFVCEDQDEILGMIELKEGRHVAMLFVSPDCQKQGIGRKLVSAALKYSRVRSVTVSASLQSVPVYTKYGFCVVGEEEGKEGLRYIPMKIDLD
ncbi:MAG: GNAT family N-acetyltransferase [Candidatus Thiodiazotropha sp. (ex. Lucinisca nassula)]|nr:GNAT family N-acetyltransferase [Candidatus Thiodiazotropha sp. (ex. Lucinisca nassula)]